MPGNNETNDPAGHDCRLLDVIAAATSDALRAATEPELFGRVTGTLVAKGMAMAWVGLVEPTGRAFVTAGSASRDATVLAALESIDATAEDIQRMHASVQRGESWSRQVPPREADAPPGRSVWMRIAQRAGMQSVGFFPLGSGYVAHGVLIVGTDHPDYFDPEALALFERLARDCGTKLDWIGRHHRGPGDLAGGAAASRAHIFFDLAVDAILLLWPDRIEVNETFLRMFDAVEDPPRQPSEMRRFFDPPSFEEMLTIWRRRTAGRAAASRYESTGVRSDGSRFPILVRVREVDVGGRAFVYYFTDLTG